MSSGTNGCGLVRVVGLRRLMVQSTGYAVYYAPVLQWAFFIHKVQTKGVTLQFEVQDNGTSMVYHPAISPLAMNVPSGSENECNVIENLEMFIVEKKKRCQGLLGVSHSIHTNQVL